MSAANRAARRQNSGGNSGATRETKRRIGRPPMAIETIRRAYRERGKLLRRSTARCVELERQIAALRESFACVQSENERLRYERLAFAKLSAPTPQFFNPLVEWEAETLRDRVLAEAGIEVTR